MASLLKTTENIHKELAHVWGLGGSAQLRNNSSDKYQWLSVANDWWTVKTMPILSSNQRFDNTYKRQFPGRKPDAPSFVYIEENMTTAEKSSLDHTIEQLPTHNMICLALQWEGHVFTANIIKTSSGYQVIYVNRGGQGEVERKQTVQVFSFNSSTQIKQLIDARINYKTVANNQTKKRAIANIINSWDRYYQAEISQQLKKSKQTVSNCTVANKNMSWHLQLALQAVKNHQATNLIEAYNLTKVDYRKMRLTDKANGLINLVNNRELYQEESYKSVLTSIITKSNLKGADFTDKLLAEVKAINPSVFAQLNKDCNSLFTYNLSAGITCSELMLATMWHTLKKHSQFSGFANEQAAATSLNKLAIYSTTSFIKSINKLTVKKVNPVSESQSHLKKQTPVAASHKPKAAKPTTASIHITLDTDNNLSKKSTIKPEKTTHTSTGRNSSTIDRSSPLGCVTPKSTIKNKEDLFNVLLKLDTKQRCLLINQLSADYKLYDLSLSSEQFLQLLKTTDKKHINQFLNNYGQVNLSKTFPDLNKSLILLESLHSNYHNHQFNSPELLQYISDNKFETMVYGSGLITLGLIGLGLSGTIAIVAFLPCGGLSLLGLACITASTAICTASITSVCKGSYHLYNKGVITEYEQELCDTKQSLKF